MVGDGVLCGVGCLRLGFPGFLGFVWVGIIYLLADFWVWVLMWVLGLGWVLWWFWIVFGGFLGCLLSGWVAD